MENTLTIKLTNQKAEGLLRQLEELRLIKIMEKKPGQAAAKLSARYKGFITKEEGQELNTHIKNMRSEWNSI